MSITADPPATDLDAALPVALEAANANAALSVENAPLSPCDPPVTILVSRRLKKGCETQFQNLLAELQELLEKREGFVEMKAYQPSDEDDAHKIVLAFRGASQLKAWQDSPERRDWIARVKPLEAAPPRAQILTGIESWFTLPAKEGLAPPSRLKMAIVTWLAVFPLVTLSNLWLVPHLDPLPPVGRSALTSILLVTLMTYVVMPRMTRICARFLYPEIEIPRNCKKEAA